MIQSRNGRRVAAWFAFALMIAVLASTAAAFKGPLNNQGHFPMCKPETIKRVCEWVKQ